LTPGVTAAWTAASGAQPPVSGDELLNRTVTGGAGRLRGQVTARAAYKQNPPPGTQLFEQHIPNVSQ